MKNYIAKILGKALNLNGWDFYSGKRNGKAKAPVPASKTP